jgi:hypothetical protein
VSENRCAMPRNPATAIACYVNGNFCAPLYPFSIDEPTTLQILAHCRKQSFSTELAHCRQFRSRSEQSGFWGNAAFIRRKQLQRSRFLLCAHPANAAAKLHQLYLTL